MAALRGDLLSDRVVAVGGPGGDTLIQTLDGLGATVEPVPADGQDEAGVAWARERSPLHALVHDANPTFGDGGQVGLLRALEAAWSSTAAVANGAFIPAQAGRIVLIAPRPGSSRHVEAASRGLENLARTLSVEWARYGITTTAVTPGQATSDQEVATLVAYLLSPAGSYFSGCRFELGAVTQPPPA